MADVLVVDDEALVSIGLKMILEAAGDFAVATSDRRGARLAAEEHRPAVVLLDAQDAQPHDVTVLTELRDLTPAPALAILTKLAAPDVVLDSLHGGACGFLLKDSQPEQLVASVRALASGAIVLAPEASSIVLGKGRCGRRANGSPHQDRVKDLSDRERAIVKLLGLGLTNAEISRRLFLSDSTVKEYVSVILRKLGVANRVQAAVRAYAAGLITDDLMYA